MVDIKNAHEDIVLDIKLLPNGLLVSASADLSLKFWNISTGNCEKQLEQAHSDGIWCLENLSNGNFASGSSDHSIKIWVQ